MGYIKPFPALLIGRGCDTLSSVAHATAIKFSPLQSLANVDGQTAILSIGIIKSSKELAEQLDVVAGLDMSYSGIFSASASANFVQSRTVNTYKTYALVKINVQNPEQVITEPRLSETAEEILLNVDKGWEKFRQIYGEEYVSGVVTGGAYFALIEILTNNSKEQEYIQGEIQTKGWGGEFNLGVVHNLKEIIQGSNTTIYVFMGGGSSEVIEVSLDGMITQAQNFTEKVKRSPLPIKLIIEKYLDSVPMPEVPPESWLSSDRKIKLDLLRELEKKYFEYKDYRDNLDFVINNMLRFKAYQKLSENENHNIREGLKNDFKEVTKQISIILDLAMQVKDTSSPAPKLPEQYYTPKEILPTIDEQDMLLKELEARLNRRIDDVQKEVSSNKEKISIIEVPRGTIISWYVKTGSVPDGWAVCDGNNGTPDLRGRFLMGAENMSTVGNIGDGKTVIGQREIMVYSETYDNQMSPQPNGGPEAGQNWGSQNWHRLVSKGYVPETSFISVPVHCKVLYIMKL